MSADMNKSIGQLMVEQNNRSTQYPMWAVQHQVKRYHDDGDEYERTEEGELCDACIELGEQEQELIERCADCEHVTLS